MGEWKIAEGKHAVPINENSKIFEEHFLTETVKNRDVKLTNSLNAWVIYLHSMGNSPLCRAIIRYSIGQSYPMNVIRNKHKITEGRINAMSS